MVNNTVVKKTKSQVNSSPASLVSSLTQHRNRWMDRIVGKEREVLNACFLSFGTWMCVGRMMEGMM